MKETVQHIVDSKIVTSAAVSGGGAMVTIAEQIDPIVDVVSGLVAIVAGLMAIVWTGMRMYDRYRGK